MKSLREQDRTFGPVFLKGVVVSTNSTSQQNRNFGVRRTNLFLLTFSSFFIFSTPFFALSLPKLGTFVKHVFSVSC